MEKDKITLKSSNGSMITINSTNSANGTFICHEDSLTHRIEDYKISEGPNDVNETGDSGYKTIWGDSTGSPYVYPQIPIVIDPLGTDWSTDWMKGLEEQFSKKEGHIEIRPAPSIADVLVEIAKLDILEVNQILDKYGVKVTDKDGNVIYDPEERERDIAEQDW